MKNETNTEVSNSLELQLSDLISTSSPEVSAHSVGYFEMEEVPVRSMDLIEEVNKNLTQLELLTERFSFQMREVRYLLKM